VLYEHYRGALEALGLDSFTGVMAFAGGEPVRDKGTRTIVRIVIPGRLPETLYLKRHSRGSLRETLRALLSGRRPLSAAAEEWRAIERLRAAGIATMEPVAYGESAALASLRPSFIITAGVGGQRLEERVRFLRGKFREKRSIIAALANCARRMHCAGLNHRDFYLSHIFLLTGDARVRPVLIDLQRVQTRARGFNRWVVKDLAALNYSSPPPAVTRADRMRFLCRYLGRRALDRSGKRFARRIARKAERISRHDAKMKRGR
jgi:heptose I phosphotransferase